MGSDISSNYSFSKDTIRVGLWIVRRGKILSTKQDVSFWTFDYAALKNICKDKKQRKRYLSYLKDRLEEESKIINKFILRVYEISDASHTISFSSEPILFSFSEKCNISKDEAICIGIQLAKAIDYVHNNLHYANIGLSPNTVVISNNFQAKILLFLNSVSYQQTTSIVQPFPQKFLSDVSFPFKYMSPEITKKLTTKSDSDIYSYGVLLRDLFTNFDPNNNSNEMISTEFIELIQKCTDNTPQNRPNPKQILESEAFSSLVADVFSYINKIIFTDEKDRFSFFEGLLELVDAFSPRVFMHMFMPMFVDQMEKEKRFCIVILPIIYKYLPKLTEEESEDTIKQISFLFTITRPPQIIETTLTKLDIILEKIKPQSILLPLFTALQCEDARMAEIGLDSCSVFMSKMQKEDIESEIIEPVIKILKKTLSPDIARNLISCISIFIDSLGMDYLFRSIIPALIDIWMRTEWQQIADPICECLLKYRGTPNEMMKSAAALATMMLGNDNIEPDIQVKLISILDSAVQELKKTRSFLIKSDSVQPPTEMSAQTVSQPSAASSDQSVAQPTALPIVKPPPAIPSSVSGMIPRIDQRNGLSQLDTSLSTDHLHGFIQHNRSSSHNHSLPREIRMQKSTPRPSLTRYNPFDGSPVHSTSHDGESIYSSSRGDYSDLPSISEPQSPQKQKQDDEKQRVSNELNDLLHKRSISQPENVHGGQSMSMSNDNLLNIAKGVSDQLSSEVAADRSESIGTDNSSYQQQFIPPVNNASAAAPPHRQKPTFAFIQQQLQSPRSFDQRCFPNDRRLSFEYPTSTQLVQPETARTNMFISDSFNPLNRFTFDTSTQMSTLSGSRSGCDILNVQPQNQQKQNLVSNETNDFEGFDFED